MDELILDIAINKLKLKLKAWELEFHEGNGRKPNKDDISNSSDDIQDAYRSYFKMTKSVSESKQQVKADCKLKKQTTESSSVWGSSLNKARDDERPTDFKKSLNENLAKYATKLQANANLIKTNCSRPSYASRRSNLRLETKKEATNESFHMNGFKEGDDKAEEEEEDGSRFSIFGNIKVKDTTKEEKGSKVKAMNVTSVSVANRIVRSSTAVNYDVINNTSDHDESRQTFDEGFCSKRNSHPLKGVEVVSKAKSDIINIVSICSNEPLIAKKDAYEFDDVEITEVKSKNGKRKRIDVGKASSDSVEMTTSKLRKRRKTELGDENRADDKRFLELHREKNSNETHQANAMQQSSNNDTKVEPGKDHKKKLETKEEKQVKAKGTAKEKKESSKTTSSKYRDAIEAEESGFEPSVGKKPRGRAYKGNTMRKPSVQRENYVRVNLKKKVFCRGHKKFNYRKYKYGQWKQLKQEKPFKQCDDFKEDEDRPDSPNFTSETKPVSKPKEPSVATNVEVKELSEVDDNPPVAFSGHKVADPICELEDGNLPPDVELDVRKALKQFGHSSFRYGQLETIKRVLGGLSTLLIQPTGSGKSLCYLLPAYLYAKRLNAVTIVISPLVSLMDDQLAGVPKCLSAACHHTGMTTVQRQKVRDSLSAGKVDVLFLSPEGLVSGAGSSFGCLPAEMPPIAFVCIDEIHCVSAWSHNFRPSYLRLCRVVRDVLGVSCILGLTATATEVTADNIRQHLRVDHDPLSIIKSDVLPDNLNLTVSKDNNEDALLSLLKSDPFVDFNSIIIYCIRREQTERLATIIRTCLQKESSDWTAEAYHAGLSASNRRSVQKRFMSDKLRVIVATVAFGMGLNKPDVRAVIHFNMPKSIESYVQEIGRAGRDGEPAYCHLFLDLRGGDRQELRRHVYANTVDRAAVKKLLCNIFRPCRCNTLKNIEDQLSQESDCSKSSRSTWKCAGHEVAYVVDDAVEELDMKEEGIDTLLCYLEAHPSEPIKLLNRTYGNCVVFSYGGAKQLTAIAQKCPAIAIALALQKKKKKTDFVPTNQIEFNLTQVAAMLGQESYQLRRQLKKLQWATEEINGAVKYRKTDFVVDFKGVAFHLKAVGDLSTDELDELTDYLHKRILLQENIELGQLDKFHSVLHNLSTARYDSQDELNGSRSQQLKETIRCHFQESAIPSIDAIESWSNSICLENIDRVDVICNTIRQFLGIHNDTHFTGRAIARIFHGIGSPRYPATVWGKARQFWRCLLDVDFNVLCKLATKEILR